jgi:hypothetical protein
MANLQLAPLGGADDDEDDEDIDPDLYEIFQQSTNIRKICHNPECLASRMRTGTESETEMKMMLCTRCKVATYCSVRRLAV